MRLLDRMRAAAVPHNGTEAECWVGPEQVVEVAGRTISGGLFYLGRGLKPATNEYWLDVEPALIDPTLRVAARPTHAPARGFALSYADMGTGNRAAYLEWLAGDRRLADAGAFFHLYLSGLERRLFVGQQLATDPAAEWHAIYGELDRLRSGAGDGDYQSEYQVSKFAGYLETLMLAHGTMRLEPPRERKGWELPGALRIQFGCFAHEGKPLPAEWALSWALTSPEAYLRTPAQRLPQEFEELFVLRYQERFGEGMTLPTSGPQIKIEYQTLNYGLPDATHSAGLPDVVEAPQVDDTLRELGHSCCDELDALSRWLGRNPDDRDSFKAAALLPVPLLHEAESEELVALRDLLEEASSTAVPWVFDPAPLIELWSPGSEKLSKKEAVIASQLLEKLGYGIEPDPRFGAPSLLPGMEAILFEIHEGDPRAPSPAYAAASLLLHLLAAVAAADGTISPAEEELLESQIHGIEELYEGERHRLHAHTQWLTRSKPKFAGLRKKLKPLDNAQREAIGKSLIALAAADGEVAPGEVKTLGKVFDLLDLDPDSVFSELHAASSGSASGPVVVREARTPSEGHAIPLEPSHGLDRAAIDEKIEETALVSSLLAGIFEESEEAPKAEAGPIIPEAAGPAGLSPSHLKFARELAGQPSWSRLEAETLADRCEMMIDGALEAVNDAAFELCDAPFAEGDDPIEIDEEVAKEMLA